MAYEALLVDGVDLASIVECVQSLDGLWSISTPRGDDLTIPGVDGELWTDKPYGAGAIDLGLIMKGSTTTEFNDQYRQLKKLIRPGKLLSLERHLSYTSGNEQHVAQATFQSGLSPTIQLMRFGKTTLSLKILDGVWYGKNFVTESISSNAQAVTGVGETRTHKMTITMHPSYLLSNDTTGHYVRLDSLPDMSTIVTIDVMSMTATQGAFDVSYAMSWNKRYPFQILPGLQAMSYSGAPDGASINYYPAYT